MRGSMVDIQSTTAEIRRGKKKIEDSRRNHREKYNGLAYFNSYNSSRRCKHRRPKRYPQEVVRLIAKKRTFWKKRTLRPNDLRIRWKYRECVNALRSSCRRLVRDKEESIVDANNLGTFYRYVNQQLTLRGNIEALVGSAGQLITSEGQKADMFNVYFGSVCITDNDINPRCPVSEITSVLEIVNKKSSIR